VLAFFGLWAAIWLPIAGIVCQFIGWQPSKELTPKQKLILLASLYVMAPAIVAWKIKGESLSFTSLGLHSTANILPSILLGLAVSLLSVMAVFALELTFGLVSWHQKNLQTIWSLFFPILILSFFISFIEELVFRGYVFSILLSDNPYWLAAIVSSMIFALLHLIWERKQTLPQIPGLWLMGMVLISARIVDSHSLYLAIGLHAGWIWSLTCIDSAQLLTYNYSDRHLWITGINQQPLAGGAGLFCLIVTGFVLWAIGNYRLLQLGMS
jgi:membrane protease YdiL (CAAX protease family)